VARKDVTKFGKPRVRIYHNSMWARYKGAIFSKIFALQNDYGIETAFTHVGKTSDGRAIFGPSDLTYHAYPYRLLFPGNVDLIPTARITFELVRDILCNPGQLIVIPGYHRFEYWGMLLVCMLIRRRRAVFCDSTANDNLKSPLKELAKSFFFRRCHGIFCYGIRSSEYIQSYGVDASRTFSPCQAVALPNNYDSAALLDRYQVNQRSDCDAPVFLFVGRLSAEKGLWDLLSAFRGLRAAKPRARLVLAGPGDEREHLERQAMAWKLDDSIEFLGNLTPEEIGGHLETGTALVLPSHTEPWGLVVNEALSYGCPVVVSDTCGCTPELVVSGVTGYVFPVGDAGALHTCMLKVISLSDDRYHTAQRCMQLVSQYTPERAAREILKGCSRILEKL
jgi:glycosyltransferase involved in cell wall biosynthesis